MATGPGKTSRGRRVNRTASGPAAPPATTTSANRELIVLAYPEAGLRALDRSVRSVTGTNVAPLAEMISSENIEIFPLFGLSEDLMKARSSALSTLTEGGPPDLSIFYKVMAPDARLEELAEQLREQEAVEAAYIKPPAELPQMINDMAPLEEPPPPATSDFSSRQGYLNAAPGGVDARSAWAINGGSGSGVRIIDIEGAWRFSHEDLLLNQGGVVGGTQTTELIWRNHGTAVIGEFSGDRNGFGITGICPEANVRAISIFGGAPIGWGSAAAIRQAADMLNPGDILLIELHRAGPRFNFSPRNDQLGYIAIEWWPDDMAAIQYAIGRGVIVVEAGGNGAENLDDPIYNANPAAPNGPFPAVWRNPFRRNPIDTGTIIVGAGAPPPGTHGADHGPDRSRLDFSNFGSIFDAQAWGREVTTCGYGDLQGGVNEDLWYTDRFSGTSSASPIVVGAIGCVQGALRAAGQTLLNPMRARNLLRSTGSPQQDAPGRPRTQRIGNRPDIRQMIQTLLPPSTSTEEATIRRETGNATGFLSLNVSGQVTININVSEPNVEN